MSGIFDQEELAIPTDPEEIAKLVKGKAESDKFIEQLKKENAEMRTDLTTRLTVEEALEKARPANPNTPTTTPAPTGGAANNQNSEATGLSEDALMSKVKGLLEEERTKETRTRNRQIAVQNLREVYGSDYATYVTKAAEKLGVITKFLEDMADTSPEGLMNVVKGAVPVPDKRPEAPPSNQVNTGGIIDPNTTKNNSYYQKLRKESPKVYYSPKIQIEMMKQAESLGNAFYQ